MALSLIHIYGIDIRKIKISCLRKHFGQMLQDVFLFSGTIRSNIVLREEKDVYKRQMPSSSACSTSSLRAGSSAMPRR